MIIALDYDKTYTAAPVLFDIFCMVAKALGVEVVIVTMRHDHETIQRGPRGVMIYYTGRRAKRPFMDRQGIHVDIWIDDDPVAILTGYEDYVPAGGLGKP